MSPGEETAQPSDPEPVRPDAAGAPADAPAGAPVGGSAGDPDTKRDPILVGAVKAAAVTALLLTLAMAVLVGVDFAVGTVIGGVLATLNLLLFVRLGEAFLAQNGRGTPWAILGGLKLLGLFVCVAIILKQGAVSALAFVIGYGALPIGITLSSLFKPTTRGAE